MIEHSFQKSKFFLVNFYQNSNKKIHIYTYKNGNFMRIVNYKKKCPPQKKERNPRYYHEPISSNKKSFREWGVRS